MLSNIGYENPSTATSMCKPFGTHLMNAAYDQTYKYLEIYEVTKIRVIWTLISYNYKFSVSDIYTNTHKHILSL